MNIIEKTLDCLLTLFLIQFGYSFILFQLSTFFFFALFLKLFPLRFPCGKPLHCLAVILLQNIESLVSLCKYHSAVFAFTSLGVFVANICRCFLSFYSVCLTVCLDQVKCLIKQRLTRTHELCICVHVCVAFVCSGKCSRNLI